MIQIPLKCVTSENGTYTDSLDHVFVRFINVAPDNAANINCTNIVINVCVLGK